MTIIDRELALDRLGGDEELWNEISKLFVQECPQMLRQLQEPTRIRATKLNTSKIETFPSANI